MHKVTIYLQQHTPIIHFHGDYAKDGATLRASELKPKLDRFIISDIGWESVVENNWHIVTETSRIQALDYKLTISAPAQRVLPFKKPRVNANNEPILNNKGKQTYDTIPLYFGDTGNNNTAKKLLWSGDKTITLQFFSRHESLLRKIQEVQFVFFASTNFGTRQSKGFGSFYPIDTKETLSLNHFSNNYYFIVPTRGKDDWHNFQEVFEKIDILHKLLRSGINFSKQGFYFKSLMFHYALFNKKYYDKRHIRYFYELFTPDRDHDIGESKELSEHRPWNEELSKKSYLYRDMLGLSTSQEWGHYHATINKEHAEGKDNELRIERFKSPITFKPLQLSDNEFVVILLTSDVPTALLSQVFRITSKSNGKGPYLGVKEGQELLLSTPAQFNVCDYLHYAFADEGKRIALAQVAHQKHRLAREIESIYKKIHCPETNFR